MVDLEEWEGDEVILKCEEYMVEKIEEYEYYLKVTFE